MSTQSRWTGEPFGMGTSAEFDRLRALFVRVGFTEPQLCQDAGAASMYEFPAMSTERLVFRDLTDARAVFVRLFLDGENVAWSVVRSVLPAEDLAAVEALGLLRDAGGNPDECKATVALYPTEGVYVASDRHTALDSTTETPPADIVYSAMTAETHRFMELMPREPCGAFLELCSGSGIAALVAASRFATHAWAVDITERSTRFARFNAALNGLTNLTALEGDLYVPLAESPGHGGTFDRIVAHPPYMPAFETEMVYRDGGEDGEQITRRIIAGLGDHLRPGGQFYCDCMMTDRTDAPLQQRMRDMLGPPAPEFDVVLGQVSTLDPIHYYADRARKGQGTFEGVARRNEAFSRLGIEQFVETLILLQRQATKRPVVTTRRALTGLTTAADFQWLLHWLTTTAAWGDGRTRRLLDSRPRTLPRTEVRSRSTLHDGGWRMVQCMVVTLAPFAVEATCPTWVPTLLVWCDGHMTAREHLQHLKDARLVPDDAAEETFAGMIQLLVDSALVEIEEFPLPAAASQSDSGDGRPG
jgi:methylase of polypeptide subunit release factors